MAQRHLIDFDFDSDFDLDLDLDLDYPQIRENDFGEMIPKCDHPGDGVMAY